ncbi:MAG: sorbosone dehydrogenase family protein [Phenylobacterium sp.]|jgi:glucose/arabinose dehydrogenase|uniref:PQQ-dependent sugar dehydrogenase n=1 Tax=Phenylobacterium sp. TaxID=1871053 RepID=UPI002A359CBF|nr:sorbosone dehydrogenase family protein [Phenylobacterium sp.]MDX9996413.1 sorbosone dehydrogenase family protein [Phenylobacterium sp.]
MRRRILAPLAALAVLAACASPGSPDPFVGFGPDPQLPPPQKSLLPTVAALKVVGWPEGRTPQAPPGFVVTRFAGDLDHPRWLHVLPNGDVLVAQSSTEPKPPKGLRDWVAQRVQKRAGALTPSPNNIILLRDADGDGVAEVREVFAEGLKRPTGMALVGETLFVANDDALVQMPYTPGATRAGGPPVKVVDLPAGINHHWVKNVVASPDGAKLYVSVGSNSNIGENGMEAEEGRAAIHQLNPDGTGMRLFASGLRNPNGMDFEPVTGALWTAVNERDELGNDLVPDYMTSVREDGFYGWPYSYFGQNVDERVKPQRPDLVARAIKPDYALGPHTASLGLAFYRGTAFPAAYHGGAFVGQHGSWNRKPPNGYRVVFIPFAGGRPTGEPSIFLSGFLNEKGEAYGRPVDVKVDARGALLVTDDAGKAVWRVAPAAAQ